MSFSAVGEARHADGEAGGGDGVGAEAGDETIIAPSPPTEPKTTCSPFSLVTGKVSSISKTGPV